jgi:hypothetical protein
MHYISLNYICYICWFDLDAAKQRRFVPMQATGRDPVAIRASFDASILVLPWSNPATAF